VIADIIILQDGLGDTIRVSLTEAPEQEIDPCTKLANLGMKISAEQKGVVSLHHMYLNHMSEKLDAMKFSGSFQTLFSLEVRISKLKLFSIMQSRWSIFAF